MTGTFNIAGAQFQLADILRRISTESLAGTAVGNLPIKTPAGKLFGIETLYQSNAKGEDKTNIPFGEVESNYAGDRANQQEFDVLAEVRHKVLARDVIAQTKKLKSTWSIEAMQDMKVLLNEKDFKEVLEDELVTEIKQEIDKSFIEFAALKATRINGGDLKADIDPYSAYAKIVSEGMKMATAMKRQPYLSAICSPLICGVLMAHPSFKPSETLDKNTYFVGEINNVKIFLDVFNTYPIDDYAIVMYNAHTKNQASSSLIFTPYQYEFVESADPDTGENVFFHFMRYDIVQHPLDDITDGQSKFIKALSFTSKFF